MDELIDVAEQVFMQERYKISDEELVARVRSAPEMGGAMLVQLSEFVDTCPARDVA